MSGIASRQKGIRNELLLRDELIKLGYEARRIPLSGAQSGFECDVEFFKNGVRRTAEVKSRKDSFKLLYRFMAEYSNKTQGLILAEDRSLCAAVGFSLEEVMSYVYVFWTMEDRLVQRTARKLTNLRKVVGKADVLAVKDDRKPFIYVRYV
jgi:hypothetical protein